MGTGVSNRAGRANLTARYGAVLAMAAVGVVVYAGAAQTLGVKNRIPCLDHRHARRSDSNPPAVRGRGRPGALAARCRWAHHTRAAVADVLASSDCWRARCRPDRTLGLGRTAEVANASLGNSLGS